MEFVSSICEAFLYRTITDKINYRAGRYFLFLMLFNAGMWSASVCECAYITMSECGLLTVDQAFLPSSFAMYANTIAFAFSIEPASHKSIKRTLFATVAFATGAFVGWPFALAVAIPFVFEELFLYGTDMVSPKQRASWAMSRWFRMIKCGFVALLLLVRTDVVAECNT